MCPEFIQVRFNNSFSRRGYYYNSWITIVMCLTAVVMNFQSYLAGLAASGALTSALRLVTKAAFERSSNGLRKGVNMWSVFPLLDIKTRGKKRTLKMLFLFDKIGHFPSQNLVVVDFAVLFLAISTFFEILCILLYAFVFPKLPIVKYYRTKVAAEGSKTVAADLAVAGIQTEATERVHKLIPYNLKSLLLISSPYRLIYSCQLNRLIIMLNNWSAWATNNCSFRTSITFWICTWFMSWHCQFSLDSCTRILVPTD